MSSPCSKEYWEKVTLEWLALSAEMRARYNDLATSASDAAFSETVAALALLDDAFCNSRGEQQEPRPPSYLSPWIEWCVWVCVCGGGGGPALIHVRIQFLARLRPPFTVGDRPNTPLHHKLQRRWAPI